MAKKKSNNHDLIDIKVIHDADGKIIEPKNSLDYIGVLEGIIVQPRSGVSLERFTRARAYEVLGTDNPAVVHCIVPLNNFNYHVTVLVNPANRYVRKHPIDTRDVSAFAPQNMFGGDLMPIFAGNIIVVGRVQEAHLMRAEAPETELIELLEACTSNNHGSLQEHKFCGVVPMFIADNLDQSLYFGGAPGTGVSLDSVEDKVVWRVI